MTSFGTEVRRARERTGLSQIAFAELAGCHSTHIARIELGQRVPAKRAAVRIAVAASTDERERCRLVLSAGYVPPGYVVTGLRRTTKEGE